jgi:hypothetical protein
MLGFRYSGFVPPVHARIGGFDQIGKSPSRGFAPRPLVFSSPETRCPEVAIPYVAGSVNNHESKKREKKKDVGTSTLRPCDFLAQ